MKFKSQVFTQASGSIGGITYSHNKGGMYTRSRATPTNPNSPGQQAVRMYFENAVAIWRDTLTTAERGAWEAYAAGTPKVGPLGDPVPQTGLQWYVDTYVTGARAGIDPSSFSTPNTNWATAPATPGLANAGTLSIDVLEDANGTITVGVAGAPFWASDADSHLIAQICRPQHPTINYWKGPFRVIEAVPGNATPITSTAFDLANMPDPGNGEYFPIVGQAQFMRFKVLALNGKQSAPVIIRKIAAA